MGFHRPVATVRIREVSPIRFKEVPCEMKSCACRLDWQTHTHTHTCSHVRTHKHTRDQDWLVTHHSSGLNRVMLISVDGVWRCVSVCICLCVCVCLCVHGPFSSYLLFVHAERYISHNTLYLRGSRQPPVLEAEVFLCMCVLISFGDALLGNCLGVVQHPHCLTLGFTETIVSNWQGLG